MAKRRKTETVIKRRKFNNYTTKLRIIKERGTICEICHTKTDDLQLDHIIPLWVEESTNEDSNLQLLCYACHKEKTRREMRVFHKIHKTSLINNGVWVNKKEVLEAEKLKFQDLIKEEM